MKPLIFGLFLMVGAVSAQQALQPTTQRLRTIFYESSLTGNKTYTLIQDSRTGGACWWEVAVNEGGSGVVYAVPLTSTQCVP